MADPDPSDAQRRARLTEADVRRVDETVRLAWGQLPAAHRELLKEIGASQWQVVNEPLGSVVDGFMRSGGHPGLSPAGQLWMDKALAVWIGRLRLMVMDGGHRLLEGLDEAAYEWFVYNNAWHEWGHALSLDRCSPEDVAAGRRLLELAPEGVRESILHGGYRVGGYTHELVANVYALLMIRRWRNVLGRPEWLNEEIYNLVVRVTGWTERE
jgi:hypothetical protein